jgi:hypothetical protein
MHQAEVVEGLCPAETFLDKEAEIFVELGGGGAREIVFASWIVRLESLLKGHSPPCCLLGALFESFRLRDAHFGIAGAVDLVFGEKMDEATLPGGGEVAEPDGVSGDGRPVDGRGEF